MRYKPDQVHKLPLSLPFAPPENQVQALLRTIKEELQALKALLD
jgi:hypothetical protein